jgi:hypothetical protein
MVVFDAPLHLVSSVRFGSASRDAILLRAPAYGARSYIVDRNTAIGALLDLVHHLGNVCLNVEGLRTCGSRRL